MIRREFVLALILARWAWWRHNDRSLDGLRNRRGGGLHRGILLSRLLLLAARSDRARRNPVWRGLHGTLYLWT